MHVVQLGLLVALLVVAVAFGIMWWRSVRAENPRPVRVRPSVAEVSIGFVVNFFDTLGVGSFAPTTVGYRILGVVQDELIPATLNVGGTAPTLLQAFIFIAAVSLDPLLLAAMLAAAVLGAWAGAGVVVRLGRRHIQIAMGVALCIAAALFALTNLHLLPGGGTATALEPWKFAVSVALNLIFGALMTVGIGLYGPCMITLALLGMNPVVAFPVMMGSCAFLMPTASVRFLATRKYSLPAALGLAIGGVPGVLLAAYVVKSLPLTALRWLVVGVVVYVAAGMLHSAFVSRDVAPKPATAGGVD